MNDIATMKLPAKRWVVTVHYKCDRLGVLDVDFCVDDLSAIHLLIENGPGYSAVTFIEVNRNPLHPEHIKSLEELSGKVESQAVVGKTIKED